MALSEQVESSLKDAQSNLRNALSFSARSEKSYVSKHIADMLSDIDNLMDAADLIDRLDNCKEGKSGAYEPYFKKELGVLTIL